MRIVLPLILVLLCLPICSHAETSLGGLHTDDNLAAIWKTMDMPEMIQARRRNGPDTDQAVLMYRRQGASVYVGLTPVGDRLEHMLTESPAIGTNDGIKVGDPRSTMVEKRGEPEETSNDQPGVTECWYWSQGINFAINESTGRIMNIFIFPVMPLGDQLQEIRTFEISHEYTDAEKQSAIVGRISNKSDKPQHDVRVGITLYDKDNRVMDVLVSDIGSLMPGAGFPFRAGVQPRGQWSAYSVDCLTHSLSSSVVRSSVKIRKSSLMRKNIIVLPVSEKSDPK